MAWTIIIGVALIIGWIIYKIYFSSKGVAFQPHLSITYGRKERTTNFPIPSKSTTEELVITLNNVDGRVYFGYSLTEAHVRESKGLSAAGHQGFS